MRREQVISEVNSKSLMNIPEFCAAYSVSRTTFYAQMRTKKLKVCKLGSRTYVKLSDAQAWMNALTDVDEGGK